MVKFPLGADVEEMVGALERVVEILPHELLRAAELAPDELIALVYGAKVDENQLVTEYEPLLPDAPGITAKLIPSYEYSQLVIAPPPFEAEKLTVAFDPLHDVEFETPVGTLMYVNPPVNVLTSELGFVKTTFADPVERAGLVQVNDVDELNTTEVQLAPPIVTVAPETKSVPVRVMVVPPVVFPKVGEMLTRLGGTAYVKPESNVVEIPSLVTTTSFAPDVPVGVVHRI